MKKICPLLGLLLVGYGVLAAPLRAAEEDWERWATPEEAGFSSSAIAEAERLWQGLPAFRVSSFFVVYRGKVLASLGSETYPYWCHSMRKSFLSALYGVHVERGNLDLNATMAELGIDDTPRLTAAEKRARVIHLLKARSGIYHEAACEAQSMKDARPERGSHPPDTFWYYNNWDFNALGTIFRQETGRDIFDEFAAKIGRPLGMQDFEPASCHYAYEMRLSEHPCYTFRMSTRDRARFGQLFLRDGLWNDRRVVSSAWIEESTRAHSAAGAPGLGYGYMWWTWGPELSALLFADERLHPLEGYLASGYGGQMILVLPHADMVVVFGVDVPAGGDLDLSESAAMIETVFGSAEIVDLAALRLKAKPSTVDPEDQLQLRVKVMNRGSARSPATRVDFYLTSERVLDDRAIWLGESDLAALAAGKRRSVRLRVPLPEAIEPGSYYLAALVDGSVVTLDLRRDNNLVVRKKAIAIR